MIGKNLTYLLISLFSLMIIPVIMIVIILGRHIFEKDGNIAALRQVIFWASLGKVLLILIEIFVLVALVTPIKLASLTSLIALNAVALFATLINWWAVFKLKDIKKNL